MTIDAIAKVVQAADAAFNEGSHVTLEEAKRLLNHVNVNWGINYSAFAKEWPNFPKWCEASREQHARIKNFLHLAENMLLLLDDNDKPKWIYPK